MEKPPYDTLEPREYIYTKGYRSFIKKMIVSARRAKHGVLTKEMFFRTLCKHHPDIFNRLLGRPCTFPNFTLESPDEEVSETVYFSAEVDRFLSVYGGIMEEILKLADQATEIDVLHIVAAFLWQPEGMVLEFLNFNGLNDQEAIRTRIRKQIRHLGNLYQRRLVAARYPGIKRILHRVHKHLKKVCVGQETAIRTIISQLNLFWTQTPEDRKRRPLSLYFCGDTGTGKSLLAKTLCEVLSKECGVNQIPEIDMSRFATSQVALDLIGRDSSWQGGGHPGVLTNAAAQCPNGIIVIENFDRANPEAAIHVEMALSNGELKDNYTEKMVSFANNIVIIVSNKGAAFFQSDSFLQLCKKNNMGLIPRDALINGLSSVIERTDPDKANFIRMTMNKCDELVFFNRHNVETTLTILNRHITNTINRLKRTYMIQTKCNISQLCTFFLETLEKVSSAHGLVNLVDSVLYIPIQNYILNSSLRLKSKKTLQIQMDSLPDLEGDFGNGQPYTHEWILARTRKRLLMAKRLDYRSEVGNNMNQLTLHMTALKYQVLPYIEDAGFFTVQIPDVSFPDLVGLDIPMKSVRRIMDYIRNPQDQLRPELGLIFHGPPGTGKTSFAKAIARELEVPFISVTGPDLNTWGVNGIKALFETAKRYGCVIFIDEIDCIGNRVDTDNDNVIDTLLAELDGYKGNNNLVIGATNNMGVLDEALTRPGRLHELIYIGELTNSDHRRQLIDIICKKAGTTIDDPELIDLIVQTTVGCTPATLHALVRETLYLAKESGRNFVSRQDYLQARNIEFFGKNTQPVLLTGEVRKRVALHEAAHALVAYLYHRRFLQVSIESNAKGMLGYVEEIVPEFGVSTATDLLNKIDISLAGFAAEKLFLTPSEGCRRDFKKATSYAIRFYQAGFDEDFSFALASSDDNEGRYLPMAEKILKQRLIATTELLKKHASLLQKIANELDAKGTLVESDFPMIEKCEQSSLMDIKSTAL